MTDLRGLIERVEKATGLDRELDGAIHNALFGTAYVRCTGSVTGFMTSATNNGNPTVPIYTNSVDAALALVEKMRPGYRWGVSSVAIKIGAHPDGKTAYGEGFRAHVTKNSPLRPMPSTADAPTPALAIILALLRSLDSQGVEE